MVNRLSDSDADAEPTHDPESKCSLTQLSRQTKFDGQTFGVECLNDFEGRMHLPGAIVVGPERR
jgi:hypothetical protein